MSKTTIEWTEISWNPTTGCTKISEGCNNCYAERLSWRLKAMGNPKYKNGFKITYHIPSLNDPHTWKQPQMVFVNSMSDLFHEGIDNKFIEMVFKTMSDTPQHTYQVLTKRPRRLLEFASRIRLSPNIWIGTTVESSKYIERIDILRDIEAQVRFVSCEPLLSSLKDARFESIDWVIVGGESGPNARIIKENWVEEIHQKCITDSIPFFFKQWGKKSFNPNRSDPTISGDHVHHAKGGAMLHGKLYHNYPHVLPIKL